MTNDKSDKDKNEDLTMDDLAIAISEIHRILTESGLLERLEDGRVKINKLHDHSGYYESLGEKYLGEKQ